MYPSLVFPLLFAVQLLVIVGRMLLLVLLALDLVLGLLGVLRVPGTDCGLVYGWLVSMCYCSPSFTHLSPIFWGIL
jgi:hypothetical protein